MNVHHLELFYYVAKHGGISAAVRKIPYGIQQPAVSGQMGKLEEEVGVKLFERSPFRLTTAGTALYAHVQPFFDGLDEVATQLRVVETPELRIGGAELVLREHMPTVLRGLRARWPKLRFKLRTIGFQSEVEAWLLAGEIDVAFAPIYPRLPKGLRAEKLMEMPLALQVHRTSSLKTPDDLWAQKKIAETLVCLPEDTGITRGFLQELKRRKVSWPHVVEATSLDLVTSCVANGDGVGLNLLTASREKNRNVRVLPLQGFAPVTVGAIWRGEGSSLVHALVDGVRDYVRETWPERVSRR